MSEGRMSSCPVSASGGFTSTPIKSSQRRDNRTARGVNNDVLLDDEDTFSRLSPINYDSYDSDAELQFSPNQHTLPPQSKESRSSVSLLRCELPRTPSEQILNAAVESAGSPRLSAWEMWLVNKAKEERLKSEKKSEEERILNEKREQEERVQKLKKMVMEERIQEWLKMKKEQEKQQKLKQSKEKEEIQMQQEKQRETEQKAQQKYQNWLQRKNQEKSEIEKKEKEKAALKEEQEKKRHKRAEEKFQEWLAKANDKRRASPKPGYDPTRPYDKFCPSPSFYNPIPWKPIHTPPPEKSKIVVSCTKSQKKQNHRQSPSTAIRLRNYSTAVAVVPWR